MTLRPVPRETRKNQDFLNRSLIPVAKASARKVRLGDGSYFPQEGRVDFVSAEVDSQTDTALARAEIPNPSDGTDTLDLISGQYPPILITVGQQPEAVLIPKPALVETQPASTSIWSVMAGRWSTAQSRSAPPSALTGWSRKVSEPVRR